MLTVACRFYGDPITTPASRARRALWQRNGNGADSNEKIVSTTNKSDVIWIYKPASERRGNGIYVFRSVNDLKLDGAGVVQRCALAACCFPCSFLTVAVSARRYVHNPFLIHGHKFDLRLYILLTSCWPLKCFLHKKGLARFRCAICVLVHQSARIVFHRQQHAEVRLVEAGQQLLAPDQQHHQQEESDHAPGKSWHRCWCAPFPFAVLSIHSFPERDVSGCKWTLVRLFEYLKGLGHDTDALWLRIQRLVLLTVLPLVGQVPDDMLCWELFGFGARALVCHSFALLIRRREQTCCWTRI